MNKEKLNEQLELYEQGQTSLKEEAELLDNLGDSGSKKFVWFRFLKQRKETIPSDLEKQVWDKIQSGEKNKSNKLLRILAVAASIALIVSVLSIPNPFKGREMSHDEKAAVLKEAFNMISSAKQPQGNQEIIYEDDILIIYTEK